MTHGTQSILRRHKLPSLWSGQSIPATGHDEHADVPRQGERRCRRREARRRRERDAAETLCRREVVPCRRFVGAVRRGRGAPWRIGRCANMPHSRNRTQAYHSSEAVDGPGLTVIRARLPCRRERGAVRRDGDCSTCLELRISRFRSHLPAPASEGTNARRSQPFGK